MITYKDLFKSITNPKFINDGKWVQRIIKDDKVIREGHDYDGCFIYCEGIDTEVPIPSYDDYDMIVDTVEKTWVHGVEKSYTVRLIIRVNPNYVNVYTNDRGMGVLKIIFHKRDKYKPDMEVLVCEYTDPQFQNMHRFKCTGNEATYGLQSNKWSEVILDDLINIASWVEPTEKDLTIGDFMYIFTDKKYEKYLSTLMDPKGNIIFDEMIMKNDSFKGCIRLRPGRNEYTSFSCVDVRIPYGYNPTTQRMNCCTVLSIEAMDNLNKKQFKLIPAFAANDDSVPVYFPCDPMRYAIGTTKIEDLIIPHRESRTIPKDFDRIDDQIRDIMIQSYIITMRSIKDYYREEDYE